MSENNISIDQIVSLSKRRGFVYPGSEIYGGFGNSYTYGPLGIELKNNIKNIWWKTFVHNRADMVGIDGDIILHPKTWHASGHVGGFTDPLVECEETRQRFRADHLIEDQLGEDVDGWTVEKINKFLVGKELLSPATKKPTLSEVKTFNLMFSTQMAKTSEGEDSKAYLRPETAQAIFLEFKNVVDTNRVKIPFGIAQIGKAFRNEITPGNFIFRRLEFEQMEIEYFVHPSEWEQLFDNWIADMHQWCELIGLDNAKIHELDVPEESRAHYSTKTIDFEYDFPFGCKELYGCAYRADFDLGNHQRESGKKLEYRDPQTNEVYLPHVIEPTFGVDRTILAVLCEAYNEETLEDGSTRTVLKFKPNIAPIKVAILPLMKKDGLPEKAKAIQEKLQIFGNVEYDEGGAIGKRYRRQDEAGTPVCITVDYDSLEDETVTVRDRDTMEQERIKITDLFSYLGEKYFQ